MLSRAAVAVVQFPVVGTLYQKRAGPKGGRRHRTVLCGSGIEPRGPADEDQFLRGAAEEVVARSTLGQ